MSGISSHRFDSPAVHARESIVGSVERPFILGKLIESLGSKDVLPQDRGSCLDERLFLQFVSRTPGRPLREIIAILRKKMEAPRISETRRQQIADHIAQLDSLIARATVDAVPGVNHPTLPLGTVEESLRGTHRMPEMVRVDPEALPEASSVDPHAFDDDEHSPTVPIRRPASAFTARTLSPVAIEMPDPIGPPLDERQSTAVLADRDLEEEGAPHPVVNTPFSIAPVFGQAGDAITGLDLPALSAEQLIEQKQMKEDEKIVSRQRETVVLRNHFILARTAAERWAENDSHLSDFEGMFGAVTAGVLEAHVELETLYGFSADHIRGKVTDALVAEYFDALERAGDDSHAFRELFKVYVNLRARLGALLRAQRRMGFVSEGGESDLRAERGRALSEARNTLGVFDDAKRDDVEKAYLLRLQALDLGEATDDVIIARLMQARETLLAHLERQDDQLQKAVEIVDRRGSRMSEQHVSGSLEEPIDLAEIDLTPFIDEEPVELARIPSQHRTDRWYVEALRKPGKILRSLFFGGAVAAGVGAGGVALHEFSEATKDQMHDVGHDYSLGVIPGPFDGAGDMSDLFPKAEVSTLKSIEVPVEQIRPVVHGSSIWEVTVEMLRERGLKPTNALTSYFEHLLETVNKSAIDAAGGVNHLPDNFPLIVTPIAEEMNAMAGIKAAESQLSVVSKGGAEKSSATSRGSSVEKISVVHQERAVPTVDSPMRVMAKGEYLGKVTHSMLRAGGLNWTTARINYLNDLVWQQNLPLFERLVQEGKMRKLKPEYIPIGVELDFSTAAQEVQRLVAAKKPAKKGK